MHFVWFLKIHADTTVDCFSRKEKSRVERETEVYINYLILMKTL